MLNPEPSLTKKYFTIFVVVSAYWIISISIVFINKTLFSSTTINLNAPVFVTWTQTVLAVIICLVWQRLSNFFPKFMSFPSGRLLSLKKFREVFPVSILYILMIAFGNLSLSFVDVSFYFIGRCLTTVFNVVFTFLILNQKTSLKAILCCFFIVFGFFLGMEQETAVGSFSISGTIFGVLSSVTLSLFSIYTKKILPKVQNEVVVLSFYNNLYASVVFVPLMYFSGEFEKIKTFDFAQSSFWVLTIVSGIFGFSNGFVSALQIKVSSPLTHNISGTAKACAQTIIASYWYNEVKPALWWFSNFVVFIASGAYARVRQLEMAAKS